MPHTFTPMSYNILPSCEAQYISSDDPTIASIQIKSPIAGTSDLDQVMSSFTSTPIMQGTPRSSKVMVSSAAQTTPQAILGDSLHRSLNSPLTSQEEKVLTKMTKRKLTFSTDKGTLVCKTPGQPIVFQRVVRARKPTLKVTSHTQKKRSRCVGMFRRLISGPDKINQDAQQASELKLLSHRTRLRICAKAGVQHRTNIKSKMHLMMKTHMGLTWNQMRKQRRILKTVGISFDSECTERTEQKNLLGDFLEGEMVSLTDVKCIGKKSKISKHDVPVVKVSNLAAYCTDLLDRYEEAGNLTWDNTPEDEIWIKIGGDHGGGSFKMNMHILNVDNPNAQEHTHVIVCFNGKDYHSNLQEILKPYNQQIEELRKMTWKEKTVRVFLYGDYDFLCKLYGISGACGTYCCIWCYTATKDIQNINNDACTVKKRKLSTIKRFVHLFQTTGKGKKNKAAEYFNCIKIPIMNFPLTNVCPPYLHILLGVVKRHHVLLEIECNKLDTTIAWHIARSNRELDEGPFNNFVQALRQIVVLQEERKQIIDRLEMCNDDMPLAQLQRQENRLLKNLQEIDVRIRVARKSTKLELLSGPITSQLDSVLQQNNIKVQAFHSRSFIGNHCHKYLQQRVYTHLSNSVGISAAALCDKPSVINRAAQVSQKFIQLNDLFSQVHQAVSHCRPIKQEEVPQIQEQIDKYMQFYRANFPKKVIPKMHFLEEHVGPWILRWGSGLGRHGEQGGESIHATFNRLNVTMGGIRNELSKLMAVMKEHQTRCAPEIHANIVHPKKRKFTSQ